MIDRIEELLAELAAEEEEEREDVLAQKRGKAVSEGAWTVARASDGAKGLRDQPESEGKRLSDLTALQRDNNAAKPRVANRRSVTTEKRESGDRSGGRTAGEIALERPGSMAGEAENGGTGDRSGGRTAEEIAWSRPESMAGELWQEAPVWTVRGGPPEMDEVLRTAAAQRTVQAEETVQPARDGDLAWAGSEWAARIGTESTGLKDAGRVGPVRAGLEGLYRQTVQGLRPAASVLPPEQAGRTARAQEPGSAASLAVDELDRAVRRDSRRYDGGMSIY